MGKTLTEAHKKAFYDMLYLDVLRGEDSTGVAAISDAWGKTLPKIELFKSVGPPTNFFDEHALSTRTRNFTYRNVNVLIGHNRAATQGKINKESAHPFEFDNLVGAHNGTVSQTSLKSFHGFKEFDIDSQIIFSHLSHTEDIKEVWKDADGAMALVWWDKIDDTLNIIRNSHRPMQVVYSEDKKVLFYASELWMILVAAMRNGIKLSEATEIPKDTLFTFMYDEDSGEIFHKEESIPPFVEKPVVYTYPSYQRGNYDDWGYGSQGREEHEYKRVVIREWVDSANPVAVGFTESGELVKVTVALSDVVEAKKKILSRGDKQGYYVTNAIYRSGIDPLNYWTNWRTLTYVELKNGGHILRKEGDAYEIVYGKPIDPKTDLAPWYTPERKLNQGAYEKAMACGCLNCNSVPNWGAKDEILWLGREDFICGSCQELPFVQELIAEHKGKVN